MTWSYTDSDNARLAAIEAALQRTEQTLANAEAGLTRVREAYDQAADVWCAGTATGARFVTVRESARPSWGLAVGDSLVGRAPEGSTPVRETGAATCAKAFADDWGDRMFAASGCPRPLTLEDMAVVQAIDDAAQAKQPPRQTTAADRRLAEAWERDCGGRRP